MTRWHEAVAARHLSQGDIIIHATEGVFGLAAKAKNEPGCVRIAQLKRRNSRKPFIVVGADFSQFSDWVTPENVDIECVLASWPGPETWVFGASRRAPRWLVGEGGTIALRVTGHAQFAQLCAAAGPLVSTSANPPNAIPALGLGRARRYFTNSVDFYLPGRVQSKGRVSRIRDARSLACIRV